MTVSQLLDSMSSAELTEWMGYSKIRSWEAEQEARKHSKTPRRSRARRR